MGADQSVAKTLRWLVPLSMPSQHLADPAAAPLPSQFWVAENPADVQVDACSMTKANGLSRIIFLMAKPVRCEMIYLPEARHTDARFLDPHCGRPELGIENSRER